MPAQAWVTLIVGGVAIVGVLLTWWQKNTADRRSEWWRRTTWAFERTFSESDPEAELGWKVLETLVASTLATKDDSDIVQVIGERIALGNDSDDEVDENGIEEDI
ncbi:hypothetical protein AC1659_27545 [Rhodococcus erythropolis]|uniref:hypothetical protein n=1 Tax=Rhodococcus TaxID=1827 RepID=UPI000E4BC64E|nr:MULTISPECIES: hypothetical protein [Rhodococcus]MBS2993054.1 hypothetical protein [Rhodococcus erythropolis]MBY6389220.1 hypothetical protein [Rhodococcus erythropolis]MDV8128494.1 hypothetical protein [Rhodococcus sp. IEGM 1304]RGP48297.1 hypothetical protein AWH04_08790 [Rhodococcus erythropolis]